MAALIFVFTWVVHIPVPVMNGGYIHIGDSMIYCASFLLGGFYGAAAAGIGSMFADLAAGYSSYMIATLIIKGLMGFVCAVLMRKPKFHRFLIASIVGGAIMAAGYALYEYLFVGAGGIVTSILFNLIQWAAGVLVALPLFKAVKSISDSSGLRRDFYGTDNHR